MKKARTNAWVLFLIALVVGCVIGVIFSSPSLKTTAGQAIQHKGIAFQERQFATQLQRTNNSVANFTATIPSQQPEPLVFFWPEDVEVNNQGNVWTYNTKLTSSATSRSTRSVGQAPVTVIIKTDLQDYGYDLFSRSQSGIYLLERVYNNANGVVQTTVFLDQSSDIILRIMHHNPNNEITSIFMVEGVQVLCTPQQICTASSNPIFDTIITQEATTNLDALGHQLGLQQTSTGAIFYSEENPGIFGIGFNRLGYTGTTLVRVKTTNTIYQNYKIGITHRYSDEVLGMYPRTPTTHLVAREDFDYPFGNVQKTYALSDFTQDAVTFEFGNLYATKFPLRSTAYFMHLRDNMRLPGSYGAYYYDITSTDPTQIHKVYLLKEFSHMIHGSIQRHSGLGTVDTDLVVPMHDSNQNYVLLKKPYKLRVGDGPYLQSKTHHPSYYTRDPKKKLIGTVTSAREDDVIRVLDDAQMGTVKITDQNQAVATLTRMDWTIDCRITLCGPGVYRVMWNVDSTRLLKQNVVQPPGSQFVVPPMFWSGTAQWTGTEWTNVRETFSP